MDVDVPQDEGVGGEEVAEEEDDDGRDDDEAMDGSKRLLRWRMVEGEDEIPFSSPLTHDTMTN